MIARDYIAGDFDRLEPGSDERMELAVHGDAIASLLDNPSGPVWTLVQDEAVLGLWGTVIQGESGSAWAILSDAARARPVSLHRAALRCLAASAALVKHLYGLTLPEAQTAHRWARRLGFEEIDMIELSGISYRRYLWRPARPKISAKPPHRGESTKTASAIGQAN
jgi:hypothetical protein